MVAVHLLVASDVERYRGFSGTGSLISWRVFLGEMVRNRQGKRGANADRGLASNITTMAADKRLYIGQADSFTLRILLPNPAEEVEYLGNIVLSDTTPVVLDMERGKVGIVFRRDGNLATACSIKIGDSVTQQIAKNLFHRGAVSLNLG